MTKRLSLAILLLAVSLPIRADDWLANGDFSSAGDKWYGTAKWPADFAPSDPFTKADPFTSAGMILPLKSAQWLKEFQDFKGKGTNATLKITYALSPGLTFSQKPEDYQNMPDKIGWDGWLAFDTPPGTWVIFISELEKRHGAYYLVQPKLNDTTDQTFVASVAGMTPFTDKTIAIGVPPGDGTMVIKKIELIDPDSK